MIANNASVSNTTSSPVSLPSAGTSNPTSFWSNVGRSLGTWAAGGISNGRISVASPAAISTAATYPIATGSFGLAFGREVYGVSSMPGVALPGTTNTFTTPGIGDLMGSYLPSQSLETNMVAAPDALSAMAPAADVSGGTIGTEVSGQTPTVSLWDPDGTLQNSTLDLFVGTARAASGQVPADPTYNTAIVKSLGGVFAKAGGDPADPVTKNAQQTATSILATLNNTTISAAERMNEVELGLGAHAGFVSAQPAKVEPIKADEPSPIEWMKQQQEKATAEQAIADEYTFGAAETMGQAAISRAESGHGAMADPKHLAQYSDEFADLDNYKIRMKQNLTIVSNPNAGRAARLAAASRLTGDAQAYNVQRAEVLKQKWTGAFGLVSGTLADKVGSVNWAAVAATFAIASPFLQLGMENALAEHREQRQMDYNAKLRAEDRAFELEILGIKGDQQLAAIAASNEGSSGGSTGTSSVGSMGGSFQSA